MRPSWFPWSGWVVALGVIVLGAAGARREAQEARPAVPELPGALVSLEPDYAQGIFFAVLEGLYADGVANEAVDRMLETEPGTQLPAWFVKGCPVCTPVLQALYVYRARPRLYGVKAEVDTFGSGLAEEVRRELFHAERERANAAIQRLVEGWIRRRLDALRLDEAERTAWRIALEEGRKRGMSLLQGYRAIDGTYAGRKNCPACDAGVGACELR